MSSIEQLEKKQQELVSRLSILIDQTMVSASEEMVSSAKLNEYGAEAIELMGSIMGTKDDLSSFLEVIPVRNAIFAGAFSLEENIDIAKKYPVSWLMIASSVNLGLGAAGLITATSIFYTAGRASLIADMGAGIPIGIVHAIREGRLLANVAVGAEVGNVARFARLARVGKWISRASAALLAISVGFAIFGWIDEEVKKRKYKKELEQSIRELKETIDDVSNNRALYYFDMLQMETLNNSVKALTLALKMTEPLLSKLSESERSEAITLQLNRQRESLFEDVDKNKTRAKEELIEKDKKLSQDTKYDRDWDDIDFINYFNLSKIRLSIRDDAKIIEAMQCYSSNGDKSPIYGGAEIFRHVKSDEVWWTHEIVFEDNEYIVSANWVKYVIKTLAKGVADSPAIGNLLLKTNIRDIDVGEGKYAVSNGFKPHYISQWTVPEASGEDWYVTPKEGVFVINGKKEDTKYIVKYLTDAAVVMKKTDDGLDVELINSNFIEDLKFVIYMDSKEV